MAKKTNDEKIITALNSLDMSVMNLDRFRTKYDNYIDEAALRKDDVRAKQLIKQKIRVGALIEQLKTLRSNIELEFCTAQAISGLGELPAAIAGCKGLLAESPDFSKLGKSITSIFKDMGKSESELAKLNKIFEPKTIGSISSRLDGTTEDETSDQFKAEYAAMIDRLKASTETISKPDDTGDLDYASMIAEENKKK